MKIKSNYILQEVADEYVVVPIGEESNRIHGIIRLNHTGAFLWNVLTKDDLTQQEIVELLMNKYGIDDLSAQKDVSSFIGVLSSIGCIE